VVEETACPMEEVDEADEVEEVEEVEARRAVARSAQAGLARET
jgi:hypothetical protein